MCVFEGCFNISAWTTRTRRLCEFSGSWWQLYSWWESICQKKRSQKKNTLELYKWMDIITVHSNNFLKFFQGRIALMFVGAQKNNIFMLAPPLPTFLTCIDSSWQRHVIHGSAESKAKGFFPPVSSAMLNDTAWNLLGKLYTATEKIKGIWTTYICPTTTRPHLATLANADNRVLLERPSVQCRRCAKSKTARVCCHWEASWDDRYRYG